MHLKFAKKFVLILPSKPTRMVEHSAVRSPENGENSSLTEKSVSENPAKSVKSKSKDRTTPSKELKDSMCRDFTRDT